jgi:hypothetical protein
VPTVPTLPSYLPTYLPTLVGELPLQSVYFFLFHLPHEMLPDVSGNPNAAWYVIRV